MNAKAYERKVKKDRDAWSANFTECMACGSRHNLQTHEIVRRSQAPKRWGHRANYLRLCNLCHEGPFAAMPHVMQLAIKYARDFDNYNLGEWLLILDSEGRASNRVMQWEVTGYARLFGRAA